MFMVVKSVPAHSAVYQKLTCTASEIFMIIIKISFLSFLWLIVTRKLQFFSREIQNAKPRLQVGEDGCSIHHGRCLCQVHISSIRSLSKLPYRTSEVFMIINPLRTLLIVPSLHEKCPNTEFLLVRIFPHLDQKKLRIWFRHFSRSAPKTKSFYRWTNKLWTAQFKR